MENFKEDLMAKTNESTNLNHASKIDHTILKPDAMEAAVQTICEEARKFGFASVCINPSNVKLASELLAGSDVKVCTVVGFPLGATTTRTKAFETQEAIENGATEIDMVINIGQLKGGNDDFVKQDIAEVVKTAGSQAIVKVIIETCLLTDDEKVLACNLAKSAGAHFVKTSTGFSGPGASVEDIILMRKTVGPDMGVKASGGIRSKDDALKMIEAGATRIGASASVAIVSDQNDNGGSDY